MLHTQKHLNLVLILAMIVVIAALVRMTNFEAPSPAASGNPESPEAGFDYNFYVYDIRDEKVDFRSFKNKVVFINIWAVWCGPCKREMPSIEQLYKKVDANQIAFVMLSIDRDVDKMKRYIEKEGYSFPVYRPADNLPELLNVPSIPATFIVGKDGKVKKKIVGKTDYAAPEFEKFLKQLAAE